MGLRSRDQLAIVVAFAAAILGLGSLSMHVDAGVQLAASNDRLVVVSLGQLPQSLNYSGLAPGMVVASIDGRELIHLPQWPVIDPGTESGDGSLDGSTDGSDGPVASPAPSPLATPVPTPAAPLVYDTSGADLQDLASRPFGSLVAIRAGDVDRLVQPGQDLETFFLDLNNLNASLMNSLDAWWVGLVLLLGGGWFLLTGGGGAGLRELALPLATAISVPLLLTPTQLTLSPPILALAAVVLPLGMVPLATGFAPQVEDARLRSQVVRLSGAAFAVALITGLVSVSTGGSLDLAGSARFGSVAAIAFVPGLAAARPVAGTSLADGGQTSRRLVERTELLVAAITPVLALVTFATVGYTPVLLPLLIWIAVVLAAARFTFRPLVRIATRATLQRDLVVAAMEAERARLAADLHDDALQDVTMLVRRLEASGDPEGADLARGVADRLRAISGDLRLPILDDLGVGPALDWLVTRIERLAGGEVRLELADGRRPPPDVELAVFRVAQEALANAVKHGRPPIVVRYRASESGVSLSIDDAGPGIDQTAMDAAPAADHFGLANMQQRAEQIGAILDVRRWPTGGTHVALEWRPR
jgi:signal transduction histidine kinase